MKFDPHPYQERAIDMIEGTPRCALFLDMGLGKTASTLTAIAELQFLHGMGPALVIAPLSVARNTWGAETAKWDHLRGLAVSLILGDAKAREKALNEPANVYVTNRDNVVWLCTRMDFNLSRFGMVVIDESSSFKAPGAKRFKALRKSIGAVPRVVLLTGTPNPNGYEDLWAQICLLDNGRRLGRTLTAYRNTYFHPGWGNGTVVYKYILNRGADAAIADKIADICLSMKARDYLSLPPFIEIRHEVELSREEGTAYRAFERDLLLTVDDATVTALSAAALVNKLQQFASGAVYDCDGCYHTVGSSKTEALRELVETAAASGENVLVFYQYRHEADRIMEGLREFAPVPFRGEPEILERWNAGRIRVLLAHPASVSYGLNMQGGGHIIAWHSLTYNLEQYQQANARLHRQGQGAPVRCYLLMARGTVDAQIYNALQSKDAAQETLLRAIKEMKEKAR